MDQSVVAFDLQRMLIGNGPPLFYLEIVVRTVIIYVYTLVLLRWLGSRTVGQLSTIEFLLVIALGSAVGDAMFYPDVPLLHALAVVTLVVLINKGLDAIMLRSPRAERLIDGEPCELIRDGVVDASFLRQGPISADELFQRLREDGIEQLGEVRRAYMEKDGKVTAFRFRDESRPGLPIVPPHTIKEPPPRSPVISPERPLSCMRCGKIRIGEETRCENCGGVHWTESVR